MTDKNPNDSPPANSKRHPSDKANLTSSQPAGKPPLSHLIKTTLAAAIGVQTNKNRQQDFQSSSIIPYILAGILFTTLFILTLVFITKLILKTQT